MDQLDWISQRDKQFEIRKLLSESVDRLGLDEVAHRLGESPSTLVHQLRRDDRKRPSADLFALCFTLDVEFRRALAALHGEILSAPAKLTEGQALAELAAMAQARGGVLHTEVAALLARTRRSDVDPAPLRVAP